MKPLPHPSPADRLAHFTQPKLPTVRGFVRAFALACLALAAPGTRAAGAENTAIQARWEAPALIPRPNQVERQPGTWILQRQSRVGASGAAAAEAERWVTALAGPLGWRLPIAETASAEIVFTLDETRADLGEDGYELRVAPDMANLVALKAPGLFYAGVTLRQLMPPDAWRKAPVPETRWTVPCLRIIDRPRFGWRGLLLDPARHFIPKAVLFQMVDAMALHKLNRLQLHLTDDQGWRVEIRAFPLLTARSSWRDGTLLGHLGEEPARFSNVPHGGFYSQNDLRELVAYAAARHIVVVPEIEMPGHAGAWLAAYPEFAVFPDRAARMEVRKAWGISPDVLAPRPRTVEACRRILDELCDIFPSPWIHIGGDEAPRDQWRQSPEMQELIRSLGLKNEDELQAWFTAQLSRHLAAKGRRLVGWDEILDGAALKGEGGQTALAPNAIAMAWRSWLGAEGQRAAARAGHDTIMAPADFTYLDHYQGPPSEEPLAIGGSLSLAHVYACDPAPATLPPALARHVLGAQAQVWGEYLSSFEGIGYMTFPRACASAEVCWTQPDRKDLRDFLQRLEQHELRLQALGIPCRPLARRTSWPDNSNRVLASAKDAVIHGTGITRQPDGSLAKWKDPETILAWRVQLPVAADYRLRVMLETKQDQPDAWMEALIAGQALRSQLPGGDAPLDLGLIRAAQPGPFLMFLRAGGSPGPDGFGALRGVELAPVP